MFRRISEWLYGVPEDEVNLSVVRQKQKIEDRQDERERRVTSVDDSVGALSRDLRRLRRGQTDPRTDQRADTRNDPQSDRERRRS